MKKSLLLFLLSCLFAVGCSDYLIEINQKPQKPEESVFTIDSEGNYIVEAKGGDVVVKVTTNIEYDVVIPEAASWLSLADTRAVREETLTFSVVENDDIEARMVEVLLVDADGKELQSITINQNGADPVFVTDGEGNYVVEAAGGDILVKVTTNLQYNVVMPEEVSWLSLSDTRAVREETLRFTILENEELDERSAVVELKGLDGEVLQSITIKQKGADPLFETDAQSEYLVEAKGGEVLVKVTTNLQYDIVIAEDASWVAVGDTRAVREETLRFTASENEELEERATVVEFKSVDGEVLQSITIKQKGADPLFTTDGEGNYLVEAEGGNISVNITTNLQYNVVIEDDASWVSLLDTRAVREETLTVAVAKNYEFEERSATLKLVDSKNNTLQKITITQESDAANVPDNQIWYLATSQIAPNAEAEFGANVVSHDFADGKGVITFDGAVKSITNQAFAKYADLTMIALPQSVESIEEGCFAECANLEMLISSFATLDNRALVVDGVMVAFAPKGLASYTTPATAKRIGEYTFAYCMELVNVTIDYDTEVIGAWSFTHCEELVNAHIAESVTTIEAGAFSYCYKLGMSGAYTIECGCIMRGGTVVGLVEGIEASGTGGGYLLSIPSYTTSIATGTFMGNGDINEVVIPASVTEIYAWAFTGCHNLVRVICEPLVPPTAVFVDGVWGSFDDQHADRKICVPYDSVKAYREAEGWSEYADDIVGFNFETGEIIPDVENNIIYYTSLDGQIIEPYDTDEEVFGANIISNIYEDGQGIITFDNEITKIGLRAFFYCENLTSITIPDSVTTIEFGAFFGCSSLTSVTIPDSVTTIGNNAFYYCDNLTSVTIPDSVTTIGNSAFEGCSNLQEFKGKFASEDGRCLIIDGVLDFFAIGCGATEYTIPDSVTEIGDAAFSGCRSLTSVTIPDSVTTIGYEAFIDCNSLTSVTIPDSVTTIGEMAFYLCEGLTSVTIPDSVTTIGDYAFNICSSLTSVTIPDSVTEIGDAAFSGCRSLQEFNGKFASEDGRYLIIDGTLNSFAPAGLTEYTIPNSVNTIGEMAFYYCDSLTSVTIGDSVTTIGSIAFGGCSSLTSVYCKATTPPVALISYGDWEAFDYNAPGRKIYVPMESVEAYKSASCWSDYASAIEGYDFGSGEILKPTQNVSSADELQAALDSAVVGDNIITLIGDIVGEVTVSQEDGKNIIIDGAGYMFDGTIYINGNSRYNGIEEVNIRNVNFVTSQSSIAFIESNSTAPTARYSHNINIEECTFEGGSDVVAIRFRHAVNINIRHCTVVGLHSLAQMNGCENILIDGVWVSDATNGVSLGNTYDCVIMNSVIIASGYGVRANPSAVLNVSNSEIHGAQPLVVRNMTDGTSYAINLDKVKLYTNDLYDIIFTSSNDEGEYVEPLGEWSVTGAEGYKIFPEAEVADERAVDLGLSVKWASCNVGANAPEEYGDYFAWGETSPKDYYSNTNNLTHLKSLEDFSGDEQYDAATANWGGSWRMPTESEVFELINNCDCEWVTLNNVNGIRFIGPNGNSIFLPAAGYALYEYSCCNAGNVGEYWSSTPHYSIYGSYYTLAFNFDFDYDTQRLRTSYHYRSHGKSVRPVMD